MFNRAIQVKVVKTKQPEAAPHPLKTEPEFEKKVTIIGNTFEKTLMKVGMLAIGYIAIDTVRQMLIESAKK